jgi:hypothetical protein
MKKLFVIGGCTLVIIASYFFGYVSAKAVPSVEPPQMENIVQPDTPTGAARLKGRIDSLRKEAGGGFVVLFHLIDWENGRDDAGQAAIEAGFCTLERVERDECTPNGFFIRDASMVISLPVASDVDLQVLSPGPNGEIAQDERKNTIHRKIGLNDLQKMLEGADFAKYAPFIFTTTDGVITGIREQYIP